MLQIEIDREYYISKLFKMKSKKRVELDLLRLYVMSKSEAELCATTCSCLEPVNQFPRQ